MSEDDVTDMRVDAGDVLIEGAAGDGDVLLVLGPAGRRQVWRLDRDGMWVRASDVVAKLDESGGQIVVVERAWPVEVVFWLLLLAWIVVLAFGAHDAAVGIGVAALAVGVARVWRDRRR